MSAPGFRRGLRLPSSPLYIGGNWIGFDASNLVFMPSSNNIVAKWGDGTTSFDQKWFGSAAANYALWDASANTLSIEGAAGLLRVGAFASAVKGSGSVLSAGGNTAIARFYADDNGAAAWAAGSVPDQRVVLGRDLLTTDQTGGDLRSWGVMGHVKAYNAKWNDEQVGGLLGYLELVRASGTQTLGGTGISAGAQAVIENSGVVTVDTNHVLAGVAAISKLTSDLVQTGKVSAFYVGIYDATNWSDATARAKWKYGLYVQASAVTEGLRIGESANTAGSGVPLSSSVTALARLHADDGGAAMSGSLRNLLARTLCTVDQTEGVSLRSLMGQIKLASGVDFSSASSVVAPVEGYLEQAGNSSYSGRTSLMRAYLDAGSGNVTAAAGALLSGVLAELRCTGTLTATGKVAAYALRANSNEASYNKWPIAFYVPPLEATRGLSIGDYSSTVGDGLPIANATWLNGFFADDGGAAQTASTTWRNLLARTYFSVDQGNASADYDVIRGHLKAASGVDFGGDTSVKSCVRGYLEMAGATVVGAGSFLAGLLGEFWGDGNITGTGKAAGVMSRLYTSAGTASGTLAAFMATKQWASTQNWPYGLYIDAATIDIRLSGGPCILSGTGSPNGSVTAPQGSIYLDTAGASADAILYVNTNGATAWTALTST